MIAGYFSQVKSSEKQLQNNELSISQEELKCVKAAREPKVDHM